MRSSIMVLVLGMVTASGGAMAAGVADVPVQEAKLQSSGTLSGQALVDETEVLTPVGIMEEPDFAWLHPAESPPEEPEEGMEPVAEALADIAPAAGDASPSEAVEPSEGQNP